MSIFSCHIPSRRLLAASIAIIAACAVEPDEPLQSTTESAVTFSIDTSIARPAEDRMLELAQQIEGFAGYYCEDADLVVGLAGPPDPVRDALAVDIVRAAGVAYTCYDRAFMMKVPQVVIARKQYSFRTLRAWRDTIVADFFQTDGALGIGINYKNNRLKMKVEPTKRATVEAFAAARQLPSDGFMIDEKAAPTPHIACNPGTNGPNIHGNCFNPLPAGVEISTPFNCPNFQEQGDCTVTAATDRYIPQYGYWQSGLVIAGHCLSPLGALQGKYAYQHNACDSAQYVGSEYVDPTFFSCFGGTRVCRWSDSTWVWSGNRPVQHGTIAKTAYPIAGGMGSRTIHATTPRFYIWQSIAATEGMQVDKVGRSSGWTRGYVTDTCSDETETVTSSRLLLCQGIADFYGKDGDSGAPVFYWWWFYGVDTVELIGLYWGGDGEYGNKYYSPWANVNNDLGPNLYIQYPYF